MFASLMSLKVKRGSPLLMAVINCTPDSFYDGDPDHNSEKSIKMALAAVSAGADILDIGGESSRPGSIPVSEKVELERVIPVIEGIRSHERGKTIPISIDTTKVAVAKQAIFSGANIINDISAGDASDEETLKFSVRENVPMVLMHRLAPSLTMQEDPKYQDVVSVVFTYLESKTRRYCELGGSSANLCIDPGIGFGKTLQHNVELIKAIPEMKKLGFCVLIGASNKRMVAELTGREDVKERVNGTLGVHLAAVSLGVDILRVHNVDAHKDAIKAFCSCSF